ncbi:hypothetical protein JR316_0009085 [Psilocybe cubensis]|uniref:Uncharacterized protein n=2 Tax=Psilocybe cubensis TaxID=181762 RepID=A0ACB8GSK7_PSICU|nr:hypothetical protein JR316_0009085 [Psilocybe cubensis]KAH9478628.1 hypothetical protein JR316_0009085 [Psilocybe cubensis]
MRRAILGFRPYAHRVRTLITQAIRVDQIFHQIPPAPPPSLLSSSTAFPFPPSPPTSCTHWEEGEIAHRKFFECLRSLHDGVSYNRKRRVEWPVESANPSSLSPADYMQALISPVTRIFDQLHDSDLFVRQKDLIGCTKVDLGNSIVGVTFTAQEYKEWNLSPPYILFVPDELFEPDGRTCSPGVELALSKISNAAPSVVVTNFKEITVFFTKQGGYRPTGKDVFIKVPTSQIPATLRILSTACLLDSLPPLGFIKRPDLLTLMMKRKNDSILLMGPPQNPDEPLQPDEHLFATCRRNSDFDHVTLIRDRNRALQFFRWNKHMLQRKSELVAQANSTLHGITNQRFDSDVEIPPHVYPFDPSEIPLDTKNHLQMIHRESPLSPGGLDKALAQSKSFTLHIHDMIAEGAKKGFCTVYRCQLASIDGRPVSASHVLCLKLFDDRFQDLHDSINDKDPIPVWFNTVFNAEECADIEMWAYDKLRSVQGTVIPWFYGQHQFTLPDGTAVQGLLMEYIDGYNLDSKRASELSPAQQIQVIQSCRHAVRILDIGDISQTDWHAGQLLLYSHPTAQVECAVLIDFAMTIQTMHPDYVNLFQNCSRMMDVLLLAGPRDGGLDPDLIFEHYDDPDKWDPTTASVSDKKGRRKWIEYRGTLFPFINLTPPEPIPLFP